MQVKRYNRSNIFESEWFLGLLEYYKPFWVFHNWILFEDNGLAGTVGFVDDYGTFIRYFND